MVRIRRPITGLLPWNYDYEHMDSAVRCSTVWIPSMNYDYPPWNGYELLPAVIMTTGLRRTMFHELRLSPFRIITELLPMVIMTMGHLP